ncbi:MAG: IS1595 family transposase [Xanthobacteraceae bacterium]
MAKATFKAFQQLYPSDAACLEKLMKVNYGGTEIVCPGCARNTKFHRLTERRAYVCQHCGYHVYPCARTIFHKSRTPLTTWFFVMYLMTSTRHGVAAKEVERQTGVTYKTAWRMCDELRKLMASADYQGPLGGEGKHVEMDETLIGGKQTLRERQAKGSNKTMLFGMIERDGMMRAGPVPNAWLFTIEKAVKKNVLPGTTVSTDEWQGYNDLHLLGMKRGAVNHSQKEWVRGIHHTNTIEGHWGHFKGAVRGTHVHISAKHAWKYVAEFSYRRNFRHSHAVMFNRLVYAFALPRLQDV